MAVGILIAVAFVSLYAVIASGRLSVHHIEIRGLHRADRDTLLAYGGLRTGQSIFEMKLDDVARNLCRHPWVAEATVKRALPDRVLVEVREHKTAALVSLGGLYLANTDGELFKRWTAQDPRDVPILTGLNREAYSDDVERSRKIIMTGIEIARELEQWSSVFGAVDEVHFDPALGWAVVVSANSASPVRVLLGETPHARIPLAAQTFYEVEARKLVAQVIRVDGKKRAGRVHVSLVTPKIEQREESGEQG